MPNDPHRPRVALAKPHALQHPFQRVSVPRGSSTTWKRLMISCQRWAPSLSLLAAHPTRTPSTHLPSTFPLLHPPLLTPYLVVSRSNAIVTYRCSRALSPILSEPSSPPTNPYPHASMLKPSVGLTISSSSTSRRSKLSWPPSRARTSGRPSRPPSLSARCRKCLRSSRTSFA